MSGRHFEPIHSRKVKHTRNYPERDIMPNPGQEASLEAEDKYIRPVPEFCLDYADIRDSKMLLSDEK